MPAYRTSFITGGYGYRHGKKVFYRIHSLFFSFSDSMVIEGRRYHQVEERHTFFVQEAKDEMGNPKDTEDAEETFIPVAYDEATGLGFYIYEIRDDLTGFILEKGDLRY